MLLRIEFVAKQPFWIKSGHFFQTMLLLNNFLLPDSRGVDTYQAETCVGTDERFSAMGRRSESRDRGSMIELQYEASDCVNIVLINDILFDERILRDHLYLRLYNQFEQGMDFPLKRVEWLGRGTFSLNISIPVKEFYEKYSQCQSSIVHYCKV